LCHKAWLPENAWKAKDAQLYSFEAEVWGEEE
jgi:AMMECR1 domain-containing protein